MHILVIEGFRPAHEALKKMGAEITLLIEEFRISGNEEGFYDRYFTVSNDAKLEEWVQQADIINSISHVDRVVNFHEKRQYEAAVISLHLGLEYHSVQETLVCNDKIFMRKFLNDAKIDHVFGGRLEELNKYLSSGTIGFPLIIKPYNGWASKSISKVSDACELNALFNMCINEDVQYLFEEFVDGEEFSVETFSQAGKHKVVAVTKKFKDDNFVEKGHCVPCNLPRENYQRIYDKVMELLRGMNHMNGPMHTEVIITENKDVHIIETHLRMGGDNIPDLIKNASGFDLLAAWCDQICYGSVDWSSIPEITANNTEAFSAIRYFMATDDIAGSEIKAINTEFITKYPQVVKYSFFVSSGSLIPSTKDSFSRLGYISVKDKSYNQANELADRIVLEPVIVTK